MLLVSATQLQAKLNSKHPIFKFTKGLVVVVDVFPKSAAETFGSVTTGYRNGKLLIVDGTTAKPTIAENQ